MSVSCHFSSQKIESHVHHLTIYLLLSGLVFFFIPCKIKHRLERGSEPNTNQKLNKSPKSYWSLDYPTDGSGVDSTATVFLQKPGAPAAPCSLAYFIVVARVVCLIYQARNGYQSLCHFLTSILCVMHKIPMGIHADVLRTRQTFEIYMYH